MCIRDRTDDDLGPPRPGLGRQAVYIRDLGFASRPVRAQDVGAFAPQRRLQPFRRDPAAPRREEQNPPPAAQNLPGRIAERLPSENDPPRKRQGEAVRCHEPLPFPSAPP